MRTWIRLCLIALSAAAFAASPAYGGPGGKKGAGNKIHANFEIRDDQPQPMQVGEAGPRAVDVPTLAVPVFEDGRLLNYLFVSVRLQMADGVDVWKLRDRVHYLRDAMLREAHAVSVGRTDDPTRIDEDKAREVLRRGVARVTDPDQIVQIEFLSVDSKREFVF